MSLDGIVKKLPEELQKEVVDFIHDILVRYRLRAAQAHYSGREGKVQDRYRICGRQQLPMWMAEKHNRAQRPADKWRKGNEESAKEM
ncbi:MAG: hypothetical protein JRN15_08595 [Nitrososphaerota archaeon]|nr:hypothetical protein [Nitrososphaerota archaeon]